ncbi:hypothetical protein [Dawidia soli]|uniref:Uncharacterized protein n=1 Tax=Dawidia soli TaxID=2782352 RepID=A0AAP2D7N1_9BACT|nr:hypothetical protein [Dawidia soli]MBT1686769.1 hypothetical protein [Dawidia soli]
MSHTNELSDMNDFEKPFRDALTDLEVAPPAGGWPPIEAALDRKGFDYRTYGLLLLLLLLIGAGSLVTYHVATHVVEQQRVPRAVQHAESTTATSQAPGTLTLPGVEVPCMDATPVAGALADQEAGNMPAESRSGTVQQDPNIEIACTPRVDAGEGYTHALADNDREEQQHPTVMRAADDKTTPLGMGAARNRVIRRKRPGVAQHPFDTVYARASYIDRTEMAGRGSDTDTERGQGPEGDSVIRAHNGPPMPVRKRTPSPDGLALTPLDSLKRLREAENRTRVSGRDSVEEKKRPERKRSKWSLQVQAGANYTFKKMDPAKDLYYVTGLNNKNRPSWRNTGYQLGATARYPLARRTTLTAGISWNMLREHTDYNYYNIIADSVEVQQIAGKSIEVNAYSKVRRNDVTNTLHYLGVHVGLVQQVTFLRHERNILLALHVNRQVAATNRTQHADHRFTVNDMRIAVRAGLENRITLSPDYTLTLTPFLEQSFGSVYSEESVYTLRPVQVGLDVGLILPFYKRR